MNSTEVVWVLTLGWGMELLIKLCEKLMCFFASDVSRVKFREGLVGGIYCILHVLEYIREKAEGIRGKSISTTII
jgi:hypothetical protein